MAGSLVHWRDIYSNEDWNWLLDNMVGAGGVQATRELGLKKLTEAISNYHQLTKDNRATLMARVRTLGRIKELALAYLAGQEPAAGPAGNKAPKVPRGYGGPTDAWKKKVAAGEASILPWVESLARRCSKKAAYLTALKAYYDSHPAGTPERNPASFLSHLQAVDATYGLASRAPDAGVIGMGPGVQLEKIDPLHRQSEFEFKGGEVKAGEFPMDQALVQWVNDPRPKKPAFFLWLEKHPITLTTPYINKPAGHNYSDDNRLKSIKAVPYESAPFFHVMPKAGLLVCKRSDAAPGVQWQVFDTTGTPSTKMTNGMAYVYTLDGIYSARHWPGEFHHSSFLGGRDVRCAGMWRVKAGKVELVNRDSGHYKPSPHQLMLFVRYLGWANVLAGDAKFYDHGKSWEAQRKLRPVNTIARNMHYKLLV
ncbi:MAG TPA: hypothetical protein VM533_07170 [Fimbriiglobus sp.]|jgi:hypothetical protein|nr:hypothetical protein [Fimbriiglobus sp.]